MVQLHVFTFAPLPTTTISVHCKQDFKMQLHSCTNAACKQFSASKLLVKRQERHSACKMPVPISKVVFWQTRFLGSRSSNSRNESRLNNN